MFFYFTIGSSVLLFIHYLTDKEQFNRNIFKLYFSGVNNYHLCCIKMEEVFEQYNNLTISNQPHNVISTQTENVNENIILYSYYPYKTEQTLSYFNYAPNASMIDETKKPILFLKSYVDDEYKYLQYNDISLNLNIYLPLRPISSDLFMQIELFHKESIHDISLSLIKPFLVNNSFILDAKFVKWFMKSNFNIDIDDNDEYTIKIIDNSINMIELSKKQYIAFENDAYIIKDSDSDIE